MSWGVEWTDKARRQLRKLPPDVQLRLLSFLKSRVEPGNDPRSLASCLSGDFSGLWRFRVGDYRLICRLEDERLVVLVLSIGHRRLVYQ